MRKTCKKCGLTQLLREFPFRRGEWSDTCRNCTWAGIAANDRMMTVDDFGREVKRRRKNEF